MCGVFGGLGSGGDPSRAEFRKEGKSIMQGSAHHLVIPILALAKPFPGAMCHFPEMPGSFVAPSWVQGSGLAPRAGWAAGESRTLSSACAGSAPPRCLSKTAQGQGLPAGRAGIAGECQGKSIQVWPVQLSCRSELGCVKGVSWWLFTRLLVDLYHLLRMVLPAGSSFREVSRGLAQSY